MRTFIQLDPGIDVSGLTSSLNFTFQNGKKEQTITVSLGAYMPEEKLNLITETKELAKLCTEEDRRHEKAHEKAHKYVTAVHSVDHMALNRYCQTFFLARILVYKPPNKLSAKFLVCFDFQIV